MTSFRELKKLRKSDLSLVMTKILLLQQDQCFTKCFSLPDYYIEFSDQKYCQTMSIVKEKLQTNFDFKFQTTKLGKT